MVQEEILRFYGAKMIFIEIYICSCTCKWQWGKLFILKGVGRDIISFAKKSIIVRIVDIFSQQLCPFSLLVSSFFLSEIILSLSLPKISSARPW